MAHETIAFRCDGDERSGAGHVARCLPLAAALEEQGWRTVFLGRYSGLAGWLLARAKARTRDPDPLAPCGVRAGDCRAAVVDSYRLKPESICELCGSLPVVTMAEANRCPAAGVVLDYHLDGDACECSAGAGILRGTRFAPLEPSLAGAGRAADPVQTVLLTAGGTSRGVKLLDEMGAVAHAVFPTATIVSTRAGAPGCDRFGSQSETPSRALPQSVELRRPVAMTRLVRGADVAVSAAGFTAYELACAGVPQVAIAIADNQRPALAALRERGIALAVDLAGGELLEPGLSRELARLRSPALRRRLRDRGMATFDGAGALRAAVALTELFR